MNVAVLTCVSDSKRTGSREGSIFWNGTRAGPRSLGMSKPLQHQIIARALEIVSDEEHWTRASVARTADGRQCACFDPRAARFCAIGALNRAARELLGVAGVEPAYAGRNVCAGRERPTP